MPKILIIDDSNLSRRTMRAILESAGHHVIEASDGIAAIEQYFLEKPDLAILDLVMTGMQGNEVLIKLREIDPNARVIVATADIQSLTREAVETAGAKGFINKPFRAPVVLEAVNAVLAEVPR